MWLFGIICPRALPSAKASGKVSCSMEGLEWSGGSTRFASISRILIMTRQRMSWLAPDVDVLWIHVSISPVVHLGVVHLEAQANDEPLLIGRSVSLPADSCVGFTSVVVLQHCVSVSIHSLILLTV